jgi:hypothetical protein
MRTGRQVEATSQEAGLHHLQLLKDNLAGGSVTGKGQVSHHERRKRKHDGGGGKRSSRCCEHPRSSYTAAPFHLIHHLRQTK